MKILEKIKDNIKRWIEGAANGFSGLKHKHHKVLKFKTFKRGETMKKIVEDILGYMIIGIICLSVPGCILWLHNRPSKSSIPKTVYTYKAYCSNCGKVTSKDSPMGRPIEDHVDACYYCGVRATFHGHENAWYLKNAVERIMQ